MKAGLIRCGSWCVALAAALNNGCGSNPLELDVLAVDVAGPITVTVGTPVEFDVTATNVSTERVVWGMGSSTCQFALFVEGDDLNPHDISFRACTEDLVEQGLDPGESRTETIEWDGQISVAGLMSPLPEGQYRVYATAGDEYESKPLSVTVVNP